MPANTVDVERYTGLNIRGFDSTEVFAEHFHVALARSAYYLAQLKRGAYIHGKTFMVLLKIAKTVKV